VVKRSDRTVAGLRGGAGRAARESAETVTRDFEGTRLAVQATRRRHGSRQWYSENRESETARAMMDTRYSWIWRFGISLLRQTGMVMWVGVERLADGESLCVTAIASARRPQATLTAWASLSRAHMGLAVAG
jgi:hypothetical protein